jgi:pimeloyl-ACP methyl ester carboxylesterase
VGAAGALHEGAEGRVQVAALKAHGIKGCEENRDQNLVSAASQRTDQISIPVAITVFPQEVYRAPERWARRAFRNLIYFHEADRGGHFAAWEYPELFAGELQNAFRSLRGSRS